MDQPLHILIVEDLPTDAELAQREIGKLLSPCLFRIVETREDYLATLTDFKPDLIISDYHLPRFDGLTALKLAIEHSPLTPVVILTSALNEDTAVECMKAGAVDYVIKEHIKRLGPAIVRALEQKQLRIERSRVEEALRESEERFRKVIHAVPDAISVTDTQGNVTYASAAALQFYGHESDEDVLGRSMLNWVHPDYHARALDAVIRVLASDFIRNEEYLLLRKDGSTFFGEVSAACLKDSQNNTMGIVIIVRDISDRKRAEEALRDSEERLRQLAENITSVFFVFDIDEKGGRISYLSPAYEKIGGVRWEGTLQEPFLWMSAIHPDDRGEVDRTVRQLFAAGGHESEWQYRIIRPDGTIRWIKERATPVRSSEGHLKRIVGLAEDMTDHILAEEEKARLESQLIQAQKMESVGRLAGGVAHDFNNMLSVILGYAELLKIKIPANNPFLQDVQEIEKAGLRARDITRQLLAFSRKQIIAPRPLNLNDHIMGTQKALGRLIGEDIELCFHPAKELWMIKFDPSQVDQILMNLVINARDAMPNGGTLTIATANVHLDESYSREHIECAPGQHVMLVVSDNGSGMDKEALSHLFEPFFTTKKVGEGTGLGLATVYGIVTQNRGFITIDSQPGLGTTCKIFIPRIMDEKILEKPMEAAPSRGSGTVLLVEDDEMVRTVTTAMLKAIGYTVLVAQNPLDALALCEKAETPIDLLLTDVVMPQMKGTELRDRIQVICPTVKVLFMSGYTSNVAFRQNVQEEQLNFVQKPFNIKDLARKIREIMDCP